MGEDKQHTVLCVDDEQNILSSLRRLFRKESFRVLTASSGPDGLQRLREEEVHVVISDQRMPGMNGTEFLAQVKEEYPDIIRIVLSGYTDVDSITESINKGHIYKFLLKPWNDENLKLEIRQALDQYELLQTNRRLSNTVLEQNETLKKLNEDLETLGEDPHAGNSESGPGAFPHHSGKSPPPGHRCKFRGNDRSDQPGGPCRGSASRGYCRGQVSIRLFPHRGRANGHSRIFHP
jgi:response regulator RpfG family c-di-GMP phosphodiesterase